MKEAFLLTFHWGWLSPGCYKQLRYDQGMGYLAYLRTLPPEYFNKLAFSHPGWLFDLDMEPEVKLIPGQEVEATLNVLPFDQKEISEWRKVVAEGRLEPVTYYYVPLVAEQVSGEMLIRAIRYSRVAFQKALGVSPIALTSHDPFTLMNWGTDQQVQLAALTGHQVLLGGMEGMVVGLDGTKLPCIGGTLQRHGLESMSIPMIQRLTEEDQVAFVFATEMHWHHRTNPYERALRQVAVRFKNMHFVPCGIKEWIEHVRDWPEIPAAGLGSKGWNGGGPDQQQLSSLIKNCEILLPGLEALEALRLTENHQAAQIETFWKRLLFLNDNHIRWFVHNHKLIFNPDGRALLADLHSFTRELLVGMSEPLAGNNPRLAVWNLLGWDRTAVAETVIELPPGYTGINLRSQGEERPTLQVMPLELGPEGDLRRARVLWEIRNLPPWGYRTYDLVFATKRRVELENIETSPLVLENSRLRVTFAANGEIVGLEDKRNDRMMRGGNRLLNLIPQPSKDEHKIQAGVPLKDQGNDIPGCFSVSAEVILPEVATYHLHLDEMQGCFVLVEVDVIDREGNQIAPTRRFPIINLHWMDAPHRYTGGRNIPLGELAAGIHLRVTLWFLSEGNSVIGAGAIFSQRNNLEFNHWNLQWHYHLAAIPGEAISAEVIEQGPLRQRLRFQGKLPQCTYETIVTLLGPKDQSRIDFETCINFPEETQLGIPTPSMPPEIGSYLGSNNERPYIPGLMVTFPAPHEPELIVDAPYSFRNPMRTVHPEIVRKTWLADATEPIENFWWGLSPFTGLSYLSIKDYFGFIADSSPHFFLWRGLAGVDESVFGLSFGSSLIHPRTVTKRISHNSEWFEFGRGPGYSDFQDGTHDYSFNHPKGRYIYRYSLSLETDPIQLARNAKEVSSIPWVIPLNAQKKPGKDTLEVCAFLKNDNKNVFLSGSEWLGTENGKDIIRTRLVELAGKDAVCIVECYRIIERVEVGELPFEVEQCGVNQLKVRMPAYGIRELLLYLKGIHVPADS